MNLTKNSIKVLLALEKWGILSLGQVDGMLCGMKVDSKKRIELFFNSKPRNGYRGGTYKAMSRWETECWVQPRVYTNLPRLYTLTQVGHEVLWKDNKNKKYSFYETAEILVRHELTVSAVGLVLSEMLGLRVSTEMERYTASKLKDKGLKLSDLDFSDLWIEDPVQPKAVEVERTQKSAKRYAKLWRGYRKDLPPNVVVLYIVCFPGGAKRLMRRAEKLGADHVYFCDLEAFKSSLGRGPFVGYRGGWITLGSATDRPQRPASRRVPVESLSAGQDASARDRHPTGPCAAPSRPAVGTHSLQLLQQGLFASPPPSRANGPRPHPLSSPSPSPEGDWRTN